MWCLRDSGSIGFNERVPTVPADDMGSLVHEPQRAEFTDLPLINRWPKAEVELVEGLGERQVSQTAPGR